jgi:hypothetical protein
MGSAYKWFTGKSEEKSHLNYLDIGERTILKCIFEEIRRVNVWNQPEQEGHSGGVF